MKKKQIFKYELGMIGGPQPISTGKDAEVLSVQMQDDKLMAWIASTQPGKGDAYIEVYGTGHLIKDDPSQGTRRYVNTIQSRGLVFRFFQFYPSK